MAWQSMRSAPNDGTYFVAVRYIEIKDNEHVGEYVVVCWEDWDEPGWFSQEGEMVSGPLVCWQHLEPIPPLVTP